MYLTHNGRKSERFAERFIKTLKNKICKHMTYIGKKFYFDVLDDIVKRYNHTVHSSIKMELKDVSGSALVEYAEKSDKKRPY